MSYIALFLASPAFTFICVHNNTWEWKTCENGEGLGVFIMWMMSGGQEVDKRWTWGGGEVDVGGRGLTTKTMHWIIHSNALPQFELQTLAWTKLLVLTGKKLSFKFQCVHIWILALPLHVHLAWWMLPGLHFFTGLPLHYCEWNGQLKQGRPGNAMLVCVHTYRVLTSPLVDGFVPFAILIHSINPDLASHLTFQ